MQQVEGVLNADKGREIQVVRDHEKNKTTHACIGFFSAVQ